MTKRIAGWLITILLASNPAGAEPLSPKLALTGVVTTAIGFGLMVPYGEEYNVLGKSYCVTDNATGGRDIERGGCAGPTEAWIKAGAWTAAAGGVMMLIGFWPKTVTVNPTLGPKTVGMAATVRWGN